MGDVMSGGVSKYLFRLCMGRWMRQLFYIIISFLILGECGVVQKLASALGAIGRRIDPTCWTH